jgi:hypothetical protein
VTGLRQNSTGREGAGASRPHWLPKAPQHRRQAKRLGEGATQRFDACLRPDPAAAGIADLGDPEPMAAAMEWIHHRSRSSTSPALKWPAGAGRSSLTALMTAAHIISEALARPAGKSGGGPLFSTSSAVHASRHDLASW